jgi:CRP/FNR family cyclic AMP-dependent transcriptional regulator
MEAVESSGKTKLSKRQFFNAQVFLHSAGVARRITGFPKKTTVFGQGDPARTVMYIHQGVVKLTVVSAAGKEAVVAILGPGDFLGEGCLVGEIVRTATATATTSATVLIIEMAEMIRVLHDEHEFSDRFISYMLSRNIRSQADLIDQLFNSTEKRLARALLLLARYGKDKQPHRVVANISQETLADKIGTTRSRVNFFMNKFKRSGFIHTNGGLHINSSLLKIVLDE